MMMMMMTTMVSTLFRIWVHSAMASIQQRQQWACGNNGMQTAAAPLPTLPPPRSVVVARGAFWGNAWKFCSCIYCGCWFVQSVPDSSCGSNINNSWRNSWRNRNSWSRAKRRMSHHPYPSCLWEKQPQHLDAAKVFTTSGYGYIYSFPPLFIVATCCCNSHMSSVERWNLIERDSSTKKRHWSKLEG